jgi:hypothetical protein
MNAGGFPPDLLIAHGVILLGTSTYAVASRTQEPPETAYQFSYGLAIVQSEHAKANVVGG